MRLLHVYSGNLCGGIETLLVTLARHRSLCWELEPHFALCFDGRLSKELRATGAPVYQLGNVRASQPLTIWRARGVLTELLKRERFDGIICHAPWSHAIFGPVVRRAKRPLVFWLHGPVNGRHWSERWARQTPPDMTLCNSRFTARSSPQLFPRVRTEVLYCPVAFPEVNYGKEDRLAIREELNTKADAIVIIQISRIEKLKGHLVHLKALGALKDISGWTSWLVGSAQRSYEVDYLNELKIAADELGIAERVRFVERQVSIQRLLSAADIYCQPNTGAEGFGLTFVESLLAGVPVVTTSIGGACEIVDASCGMLVPPGDMHELVTSLRRLIQDNDMRTHLGNAGPSRAEKLCDPKVQISLLHELILSV